MSGSATITIEGYLSEDPSLRFTQSGQAVLNLSVPVQRSRRLEDGSWENVGETAWYRASIWGEEAEFWADRLRKSAFVTLTGRLEPREYESQGEKRTSLDVRVSSFGVRADRQSGASAHRSRQSAPADDPWTTSGPTTAQTSRHDDAEPPF